MNGLLDEAAAALAEAHDALTDAAQSAADNRQPEHRIRIADLADAVDDARSRLDNLRNALRGT